MRAVHGRIDMRHCAWMSYHISSHRDHRRRAGIWRHRGRRDCNRENFVRCILDSVHRKPDRQGAAWQVATGMAVARNLKTQC